VLASFVFFSFASFGFYFFLQIESHESFWLKIFFFSRFFFTSKVSCHNNFLSQKFFITKVFWSQLFFLLRKFFCHNNFLSHKFWSHNFFFVVKLKTIVFCNSRNHCFYYKSKKHRIFFGYRL